MLIFVCVQTTILNTSACTPSINTIKPIFSLNYFQTENHDIFAIQLKNNLDNSTSNFSLNIQSQDLSISNAPEISNYQPPEFTKIIHNYKLYVKTMTNTTRLSMYEKDDAGHIILENPIFNITVDELYPIYQDKPVGEIFT